MGRGSMGAVYRAHHVLTGRAVALKIITHGGAYSELAAARFKREVSVRAFVGHEGIVEVLDAGQEPDGTLYLAMELLEGETFQARSSRPGFTAAYGLQVVRAVLEPLAAAHELGVVHRDLKPENVFLHRRPPAAGGDGVEVVKLLDFGIARDPRQQSGTRTDVGLGTPYYMAPEQATNAKAVTPASDVWSVGVILYWLLAGRLPFAEDTPFNTLAAVCGRPHAPLPTTGGPRTQALVALTERCLDKEPELRPADAGALIAALDAIFGPQASLPPPGAPPRSASMSGPWPPALPERTQTVDREARMVSVAVPLPAPPRRSVGGLGVAAALLTAGTLGLILWLGGAREPSGPEARTAAAAHAGGLSPGPADPAAAPLGPGAGATPGQAERGPAPDAGAGPERAIDGASKAERSAAGGAVSPRAAALRSPTDVSTRRGADAAPKGGASPEAAKGARRAALRGADTAANAAAEATSSAAAANDASPGAGSGSGPSPTPGPAAHHAAVDAEPARPKSAPPDAGPTLAREPAPPPPSTPDAGPPDGAAPRPPSTRPDGGPAPAIQPAPPPPSAPDPFLTF